MYCVQELFALIIVSPFGSHRQWAYLKLGKFSIFNDFELKQTVSDKF